MNKKIINIKLKAGALQYTIFISVIIALLIFAFISLTYVQNKLRIKASLFQEVIHNTNNGFKYLAQREIPYNEETLLPIATESATKVLKRQWGLFDVATIHATRNKESFTKTALIAGHRQEKIALYLQDDNQPLFVVGDTKIEGKNYLPEQGAKRGSIAGHSYTGTQLIYGTIATSKSSLPEITNRNSLKNISDELLKREGNSFFDLEDNLRLVNSFDEPVQIFNSNSIIDLRFVELTGNIILNSRTKIRVHSSAMLADVILTAPEIEILDEVKGNFQAVATKQIKVGKKCNLNYPTGLVLLEEKKNTSESTKELKQIRLNKNTTLKGIIVFISDDRKDNYNSQIIIEENATIYGEVYCNQNIELKGTVNGTVYTKGFVANQFGSVYKNHIYNGKILSSKLPEQYCGLQFKNAKLKTAKWLNY